MYTPLPCPYQNFGFAQHPGLGSLSLVSIFPQPGRWVIPKAHFLSHFLDSHLAPILRILGFVLSGSIHRMYQLYPFLNPFVIPLLTLVL